LAKLRDETLDDLLDALDYRSASILRMRNGWRGEEPMTLDEIGKVFRVTRERIRQLENKALERLRDGDLSAEASRLRSWTA
jgi:RNA polymerase primary sigma factor